jgi:DNA topoisomerase IA
MEQVDVNALGPEAIELAKKFDEVNTNLVNALKARKEILDLLHKAAQSPELKEKADKVLSSRHPVLIQFVFGQ